MRYLAWIFVSLVVLVAVAPPLAATATPPTYDLICNDFTTFPLPHDATTGTLAFYPPPGPGGPSTFSHYVDGGFTPNKPGGTICGWEGRAYRAGEALQLCGPRSLLGNFNGGPSALAVSVYNDSRGCMVVTAVKPLARNYDGAYAQPETVLCHGPLSPGTAPASAFYFEEAGTLTQGLQTMGPGHCGSYRSSDIHTGSVCVPNDAAPNVINQVKDLEHAAYYTFKAIDTEGCMTYVPDTLNYVGTQLPAGAYATPTATPAP